MPEKGISGLKQKSGHHYWILHIQISLGTKFKLKLTIFGSLYQIYPKRIFPVWSIKSEYLHWILHIRFSLGTKFQLKLTTLIFWTKSVQKRYFQSSTEIVNATIELWVFKLVKATNLILNWQPWFFGPTLSKIGISDLEEKRWTWPLNSTYSN